MPDRKCLSNHRLSNKNRIWQSICSLLNFFGSNLSFSKGVKLLQEGSWNSDFAFALIWLFKLRQYLMMAFMNVTQNLQIFQPLAKHNVNNGRPWNVDCISSEMSSACRLFERYYGFAILGLRWPPREQAKEVILSMRHMCSDLLSSYADEDMQRYGIPKLQWQVKPTVGDMTSYFVTPVSHEVVLEGPCSQDSSFNYERSKLVRLVIIH